VLRSAGHHVSLEHFSIAATAARLNKFTHPELNTPYSMIDYAYQLDRNRYAGLLKQLCAASGVACIDATSVSANHCRETGVIQSLSLSNGDLLEGDFFFDCTDDAVLIGGELGVGFHSWADWFPCDRRVQVIEKTPAPTPLFNSVNINKFGWINHCCSAGLVQEQWVYYRGDTNSKLDFEKKLQSKTGDLQEVSYSVGVREQFWRNNCVALGVAAGYVENFIFDPIHFTHSALERWLSLMPTTQENKVLAKQYNLSTQQEYERVRDVHVLPLVSVREGEIAVARRFQEVGLPDSLVHRIELFKATGRVAFYESDVLEKHQWVSLLTGTGVWPEKYDVLANSVSQTELEQWLTKLAGEIPKWVEKLPDHDALLAAIRASR